jgi:multiple sugar transport system substrate-binding protein
MDSSAWKRAVQPVPRRGFLRTAGIGLGAMAAGSLIACGDDDKPAATTGQQAGTQAAGQQAPAKLSGNMTILVWSHFVPAFDKWFDEFAAKWGEANDVKVRVDHIPHLELPARHAAEIAAQGGHDIMEFTGSGGGAHIYAKHLEDLDDICGRLDKEKGGWTDMAKTLSYNGGHWKTLPNYFIRFPGLYREDLWAEIGMPKGPDSWDDLRTGGGKLKAKGNPVGIGMANHVDSNVSLLSILWSHGAKIVQEDGKTLAIDSKETREALRFGKALYDEAMTPEVLAWDDASNNQLLASKKGSWIHNPISATLSIYNAGDKDLYSKIGIANTPAGPAMRRTPVATNAFGIWKFARNKDAARAFLNHYVDNWMEGYKVSLSYDEPMLKGWVDEGFKFVPTIKEPTKINELKEFTQYGALYGWPGPLTAAAEEWWQTFIIPQMFAKVARGTSADDAIKEATAALKKIYDKHNT